MEYIYRYFSPAFSNKPFSKRMQNPQGKALAERDGLVRDIRRNLELHGYNKSPFQRFR